MENILDDDEILRSDNPFYCSKEQDSNNIDWGDDGISNKSTDSKTENNYYNNGGDKENIINNNVNTNEMINIFKTDPPNFLNETLELTYSHLFMEKKKILMIIIIVVEIILHILIIFQILILKITPALVQKKYLLIHHQAVL